MNFITNYTIENYILSTQYNDFPENVRVYSQMCAIDLMGALILGCKGKQFKIGEKIASSCGMFGNIHIIGSKLSLNLLGASISMGHASNSFDIDDGHRIIQGHPGSSFISGVLAAAYEANITIKDFLTTLVVCYEIAIRWGMVMQKDYNYLHSSGAYGAFGTAVGIGKIYKLSQKTLNTALSIADFHAPLTPVMRSVEYPSMNKDGVPFGSLIGTMAILEAINGYTGKTHLLENLNYKSFVEDLGSKYHILDLYFKPYTCCRWAHQPIKAILDLKNNYSFNHKEIKTILVKTFKSATLLSKQIPNDTDEAQYNIAYPIAAAVVFGELGFEQIKDEALSNREVIDMMEKIKFIIDQDFENQFPAKRFASVEIVLKNNSILKSKIYEAPGEPDDPELSMDWIISKFKKVTSNIIDSEMQEFIIKSFTEKQTQSIRKLIDTLNKSLIKE